MKIDEKLYSPATINRIKKDYGFNLSKSLGQNFLTDINVINEIISGSLIDENSLVIEIGPGIGVLTKEAARIAGKVIAIEIDKKLIPILEDNLSQYDNVEVINKDILKTDVNEIIVSNKNFSNVRIIGNLPYYITTPIIMKLLEDRVQADSITVMMQREVALRINAEPGSKECGAITYAVKYYSRVEKICNVSKNVFYPVPKVDSVVLRMDIEKNNRYDVLDEEMFFKCVKAGFGQRRKTLLNSISSMGIYSKDIVDICLSEVGIDSKRRAETLTIEEFIKISNELSLKGNKIELSKKA